MANKIFGSEFTDETNPIGTETVTIFNGTTHEDVTLRNLVYKVIANAPEEFSVHDDDNLALLDSQDSNAPQRVEFSTIWTWVSGKISSNIGAIITALTGKTTPVDADEIVISDSAASGVGKKVALSDLKDYIGVSSAGRELLTANRTYYVRTDGSDSNDGLTNNSGGAFLTIQKAIDVVAGLDISIYDITIQVGNGTYSTSGGNVCKAAVGSGTITIQGDTTTPSNVVVTTTGAGARNFSVSNSTTRYTIKGFRLTSTGSSVIAILASGNSLTLGQMEYGTGFIYHIYSTSQAVVTVNASYSITGGGNIHLASSGLGRIIASSVTVTLTGTPAFSVAYAYAEELSWIRAASCTFSGSATGSRYSSTLNSVINTGGGGANYFPGNAAGSTTTGGQYV